MNKWILFILTLAFTAYWASNLFLWFPWSYSTALGITLMLTISPVLWAYFSYLGLKTYPKANLMIGAFTIALAFLLFSVIVDFIFFGLIRNAMEELYHPTTFYGYGFLLVLPLLLAVIFRKKILKKKKTVTHQEMIKVGISGLFFFGILTSIIIFGIQI